MITVEELRAAMASDIMHWEKTKAGFFLPALYYDPKEYDYNLASNEQKHECLVEHWNPDKDFKQAMRCLRKFPSYELHYWNIMPEDNRFNVSINHCHKGSGRTDCLAICSAISKALGLHWEVDNENQDN